MNTEVLIHKFNVDIYHRMIEAGALHEDDRVELIEGRIVDMTPIGTRHSSCVNRIINSLPAQSIQGRAIVSVQNPILLDVESEPEPDVALLRYREDFYSGELPKAGDILLVIEVADTSLEYDMEIKIPLYAKAAVQEVWLVNLLENCVEIYLSPSAEGYELKQTMRHDQNLSPQGFPDIKLTVKQMLGL